MGDGAFLGSSVSHGLRNTHRPRPNRLRWGSRRVRTQPGPKLHFLEKIQAKQMHTKPLLKKNKSFRSLVSAMQLSLLLIYPQSELSCVNFYMLMLDLSNILSVCQHQVHNDPCLAGSRFGCIHVWLGRFLWTLHPVLCAVRTAYGWCEYSNTALCA